MSASPRRTPLTGRAFVTNEQPILIGLIALVVSAAMPTLRLARRLDWSHGWAWNLLRLLGTFVVGLLLPLVVILVLGLLVALVARVASHRRR